MVKNMNHVEVPIDVWFMW